MNGSRPYLSVPRELVAARLRKGWERRDLATAAGVSYHTIMYAEKGRVPKYDVQRRIAEALDADPSTFWPLAADRVA